MSCQHANPHLCYNPTIYIVSSVPSCSPDQSQVGLAFGVEVFLDSIKEREGVVLHIFCSHKMNGRNVHLLETQAQPTVFRSLRHWIGISKWFSFQTERYAWVSTVMRHIMRNTPNRIECAPTISDVLRGIFVNYFMRQSPPVYILYACKSIF